MGETRGVAHEAQRECEKERQARRMAIADRSSKISRVNLGRRQGTRGKLVNPKRHLLKELREHSEPKGELMYMNVHMSILFRPVGKYPVNSRRD